MKIFSIPLNPKLDQKQFNQYISFLEEYKDWIYDIYFTCRIEPFTQDAMGDVFINDPYDLVFNALQIQDKLGITVSATFNNIHVRPDQHNLDLFIENFKPLYEQGVRSATIPHTSWIRTGQIQKAFPKLYIKNTILRSVNTASDVARQAESGFQYINIDRDLMRNTDELKKIRKAADKYGIKIALLTNESCLGGCPIMEEHYHFNSTREGRKPQYFNDVISRISCSSWDVFDPSTPFKTANLPPWKEDWDYIKQHVDVFKMHGREAVDVLYNSMHIITNYVNNEKILYGNFEQYIDEVNMSGSPINAWRKFIKNCKFDCWDCDKCDKLYEAKNGKRTPDKRDIILENICTAYLD